MRRQARASRTPGAVRAGCAPGSRAVPRRRPPAGLVTGVRIRPRGRRGNSGPLRSCFPGADTQPGLGAANGTCQVSSRKPPAASPDSGARPIVARERVTPRRMPAGREREVPEADRARPIPGGRSPAWRRRGGRPRSHPANRDNWSCTRSVAPTRTGALRGCGPRPGEARPPPGRAAEMDGSLACAPRPPVRRRRGVQAGAPGIDDATASRPCRTRSFSVIARHG